MLDFNPQLRAHVAYHNDSDAIPVARANGVTTVAVTPGGGMLGGQIAVMDLDGWTWEESAVAPSVGVAFQFPRIGGGGGRRRRRRRHDRNYDDLKRERDARLDRVARLLDERAPTRRRPAPSRQRDLVLEALVPVVERRLPLFTRANTERDIRDAVAFADRAGVRIVISGGLEAPMVAALLKEKNIPVILGPVLALPTREDCPIRPAMPRPANWRRPA